MTQLARRAAWTGGFLLALLTSTTAAAQPATVSFDRYHAPREVVAALDALVKASPATTARHTIATSPGGHEVLVLEIGPEVGRPARRLPAVLVLANMEGTLPVATEAALRLATLLASKPEATREMTYFIVPNGNPDAAARYFARPLVADPRNGTRVNDDLDDQTDEDGPEDLNGDGVITAMRVKDPSGEWLPVEADPRLMRKADPAKGEKGLFFLHTEGVDNDGDGATNEDGPGGVDIGVTFPHLFRPFTATGGRWPGSEAETYGLLRFAFAHPEIAMTFLFGATNTCIAPPEGGRKGSVDFTEIKVPEDMAKRVGLDPARTYTMQEILDFVRPIAPPGFEITESVVASFLGLGAVVNPLEDDVKLYKELSERYKELLKAVKLDGKRLDPAQARDGSPELWSYYHMGVPTFSMDLWTPPESADESKEKTGITADTLEAMSSETFVALGEAKVAAFLKEVGAPPEIKAADLIAGVKGGQMTPKQMAGMLRAMPKPKGGEGGDPRQKALLAWSDKELGGKGFVPWTPFKHPTLGEVEIGGAVPYADTTPPAAMLATLLDGQVPWVLTLAEKLARLKIARTEVAAKGGGVHELAVWVENTGSLPFPTAMGKRNQQPAPAVVILETAGAALLSGKARTPIKELEGRKATKLTWLVRADRPGTVTVRLESANAWGDAAEVKVGGAR
ncbi:MAG: hypothetical protein MUF10_00420 [Thermoanaerobaculaceae bacterium]|jgi:hypothetical protein|nr:hypothetical protein [Thermoanaerobaculaceae bacterium]